MTHWRPDCSSEYWTSCYIADVTNSNLEGNHLLWFLIQLKRSLFYLQVPAIHSSKWMQFLVQYNMGMYNTETSCIWLCSLGNLLPWITESMWLCVKAISFWNWWRVTEAQVALTETFSSSVFLSQMFLIFFLIIPQRFFMRFRSGEMADQSSTVIPCSANYLAVDLALWADAGKGSRHLNRDCQELGRCLRWLWT